MLRQVIAHHIRPTTTSADQPSFLRELRIPVNVNGHSGEGEHQFFLTHHESGFIPWVFTFRQFSVAVFASIRRSISIDARYA